MTKRKCYPPSCDLRLKSINGDTAEQLKGIAASKGLTQSTLLKEIITRVKDAFPQDIKDGKVKRKPCKEIRITNISPKTKQELTNIAEYCGTDITNLIRPFLETFIQELPVKQDIYS